MKKRIILVLALVVLFNCMALGIAESESEWGDMVYGLSSSWNSLFFLNSSTQYTTVVVDNLMEPLVMCGDGELRWRAATGIDVSEDHKTFTVHLRDDIFWEDGVQMTAADWVYTFQTITDPAFGVFYNTGAIAGVLAGTDSAGVLMDGETLGVEYIDDFTFTMTFKVETSVNSWGGTTAQNTRCFPKHVFENMEVSEIPTSDYWSHPLSNGAFTMVDEPVIGQEIHLQARHDVPYYMGEVKVNNLTYVVVDITNVDSAFLNGDIDAYFSNMNATHIATLDGVNGIHYDVDSSAGTLCVLKVLNEKYDANVRKALSMLIDRNILVLACTEGTGTPIGDNVSPSAPYYKPYTQVVDETAIAEAKALLDASGFDYSTPIRLGISAPRANEAMIIQQNLAAVGISVEITTAESAALFSDFGNGDYDACIMGWALKPFPTAQASQFNPTSAKNHIVDGKYYELCNAIDFAETEEERLALLSDYQDLIREEAPMIFLYATYSYEFMSERVSGIRDGIMNYPTGYTVTK